MRLRAGRAWEPVSNPVVAFNLIMKIKIVDELPQWIIASATAAYTPATRTIWIRKRLGILGFTSALVHELGHYFIDVCGGGEILQLRYEMLWLKIFGKSTIDKS